MIFEKSLFAVVAADRVEVLTLRERDAFKRFLSDGLAAVETRVRAALRDGATAEATLADRRLAATLHLVLSVAACHPRSRRGEGDGVARWRYAAETVLRQTLAPSNRRTGPAAPVAPPTVEPARRVPTPPPAPRRADRRTGDDDALGEREWLEFAERKIAEREKRTDDTTNPPPKAA